MPIDKIGDSTQLEFGHGDINVSPGYLKTDEVIGSVCFTEGKPGAIGVVTRELPPGKEVALEDTAVRMIFTKVESIEVVIRALEDTKRLMLSRSCR